MKMPEPQTVVQTLLVRYGAIPEVAKFESRLSEPVSRGRRVVVQSHRGLQLGTVLEALGTSPSDSNGSDAPGSPVSDAAGFDRQNGQRPDEPPPLSVVRIAEPSDETRAEDLRLAGEADFDVWCGRIARWRLELELIDLEWTLDKSKLILYVLNDRGPECTKLALNAATEGLAAVEVQPVDGAGLVSMPAPGGCGSGGCGSGGCSS